MKEIKRMLLRIFFAAEVVGFAYMYLFGAQGLQVMMQFHQDGKSIKSEIDNLSVEIALLEEKITKWDCDMFGKEKLAREQLQMAKRGDEVYYLT